MDDKPATTTSSSATTVNVEGIRRPGAKQREKRAKRSMQDDASKKREELAAERAREAALRQAFRTIEHAHDAAGKANHTTILRGTGTDGADFTIAFTKHPKASLALHHLERAKVGDLDTIKPLPDADPKGA